MELKAEDRAGHAEGMVADDNGQKRRALLAGGVVTVFGLGFLGLQAMAPSKKLIVEKSAQVRSAVVVDKLIEPSVARQIPLFATTPLVPVDRSHVSVAPPIDLMLDSARRAPVVAYKRQVPDSIAAGHEGRDAHDGVEADDKGQFERRLRPPRLEGARASVLGDRRFIVAQGTSINCTLETALQSDQPGFTSCVISRDVLSDNGQVVLMEKGTQITGEYRGGLQQGQTRLFVLWSRAKTPDGVIVELASPGTDGLGRSGLGGYVDNHWWERFGSALLLSTVSDVSKAGVQRVQSNAGVSFSGVGSSGKEAAALAVEQAAAIKPTLHKNQGDVVSIFVARDLDFSSVYKLAVIGPREGTQTPGLLPGGTHRRVLK